MKLTTLLFLSLACPALAGAAESLSIDWYTVDGGGGSSSAGEFTLSGTVGQPDAGTLTAAGGGFTLLGGYWGQFSEGTEVPSERPRLYVRLINASTLVLSWPTGQTGYLLEQRLAASPGWSDVPVTPVVVGTEYQVSLTFSPNDAPTYLRLRKQ